MTGKIRRIWEAIAACFQANDEPLSKAQVLAWIGTHYRDADFNPATLQAQLYRSCANVPSAQAYEAPKILLYNKQNRTYSRKGMELSCEAISVIEQSSEEIDQELDSTFAFEADLQNYLVKNLSKLEKGLELWSDKPPSVEYRIENRRIDILAKDSQGVPVVIELKLRRGHDQVVGQALLYRALLMSKLKCDRVRLILVANEISDELKMASSTLTDVKLFDYSLAMKIEEVGLALTEKEG